MILHVHEEVEQHGDPDDDAEHIGVRSVASVGHPQPAEAGKQHRAEAEDHRRQQAGRGGRIQPELHQRFRLVDILEFERHVQPDCERRGGGECQRNHCAVPAFDNQPNGQIDRRHRGEHECGKRADEE